MTITEIEIETGREMTNPQTAFLAIGAVSRALTDKVIWEIAVIADGNLHQWQVQPVMLYADPAMVDEQRLVARFVVPDDADAARITGDETPTPLDRDQVAHELDRLLDGRTIIGGDQCAVERLANFFLRRGLPIPWAIRTEDPIGHAVGYLIGRRTGGDPEATTALDTLPEPVDDASVLDAFGIHTPPEHRHTARGTVTAIAALWDHTHPHPDKKDTER